MITKGYLDKDAHIQSYNYIHNHTYVGLSSAKNWSFAWHLRIGMVALAWFSHIFTVSHYQRGADLTIRIPGCSLGGIQRPTLRWSERTTRALAGKVLTGRWLKNCGLQGKYWQILIDIDSVGCSSACWNLEVENLWPDVAAWKITGVLHGIRGIYHAQRAMGLNSERTPRLKTKWIVCKLKLW